MLLIMIRVNTNKQKSLYKNRISKLFDIFLFTIMKTGWKDGIQEGQVEPIQV